MKLSGINIRRVLAHIGVIAPLLLAGLSIISSFLGAEVARVMFNSVAGAAIWIGLILLLGMSVIYVRSLRRRFGVTAMHMGVLLVIVGGIWGSKGAYQARNDLTGEEKIVRGFMLIEEGESQNAVYDGSWREPLGYLDFDVHLERFWLEYYDEDMYAGWLFVMESNVLGASGQIDRWRSGGVEWKKGEKVELPLCDVEMRVKDYEMVDSGEKSDVSAELRVILELTRGGYLLEGEFRESDGLDYLNLPLTRLYENVGGWEEAGEPTLFMERTGRQISDYKSTLVVLRDGREVMRKTIQVNSPMHYGGYHFYQYDYDHEGNSYTVLAVVSDSGLYVVYGGFVILCIGVLWYAAVCCRRRKHEVDGVVEIAGVEGRIA